MSDKHRYPRRWKTQSQIDSGLDIYWEVVSEGAPLMVKLEPDAPITFSNHLTVESLLNCPIALEFGIKEVFDHHRSRVFRCDEKTPHTFGSFSLLLFDTAGPKETARRVYENGDFGFILWELRDMEGSSYWYEITDSEEVQNFLRENPL